MELLFLGVMALGAYWVARRVGFSISDQTVAVLVRGFRARSAAPDALPPRSVQDADADQPTAISNSSKPGGERRPALSTVKPVVHVR